MRSLRGRVNRTARHSSVDDCGKVENFGQKLARVASLAAAFGRAWLIVFPWAYARALAYSERRDGRLFFFLDREFHVCCDFAVQFHRHLVLAHHFNGFGENDTLFVDLKALGGKCFGNVA